MCKKRRYHKKHQGIALVVAMLFVMVFSALSVAMFSMSSNNSLVASNLHKVNAARSSAESGLEVVRYYLAQAEILNTTAQDERFRELATQLQSGILPNGISVRYEDADENTGLGTFTVGNTSSVALGGNKSFTADILESANGINVLVSGEADGIERKIGGRFVYDQKKCSVFKFGISTKGSLNLAGNILLDGVDASVESDVYIESLNQTTALNIDNWSEIKIDGDVNIHRADGEVVLGSTSVNITINGETGQNAIDNHVHTGVDKINFPIPNPGYFEHYADGITIDSSTDIKSLGVLENVRIAAGTNPKFNGVQIKGVMYIESPNRVSFNGDTNITGILVGDGNYTDDSESNSIKFWGNVNSRSAEELPESFGDDLRSETGNFIMAPGFAVSMGGNLGTLNGGIAANGVEFFGNAGGRIGGSILNYSNKAGAMSLIGNSRLYFNQTGEVPNGFNTVEDLVVKYDPSAYEEIH